MGDKLLCPNIVTMLTKTIRALCEVNIIYDNKLEINGCLYVRSDGEKVLTCLIDEEFSKTQPLSRNTVVAVSMADVRKQRKSASQNNSGDYCSGHKVAAESPMQNGRCEKLCSSNQTDVLSESSDVHISDEIQSHSSGVTSKCEPGDHLVSSVSNISQFAVAPDISTVDNGSDSSCLSEESAVDQSAPSGGLLANSTLTPHNMHTPVTAAGYAPKRGMTLADFSTFMHLGRGRLGRTDPSFGVKKEPEHMHTHCVSETDLRSYPSVKPPTPISSASQIPYPLEYMYSGGLQVAPQVSSNIDLMQSDPNASLLESGRKKRFQCMMCGIFLSAKCYLKSHINAVHTKARIYPCEACKKVYYSPGAVRIHKLRNHWQGAKKHKCQYCGELFLLPVELRKHLLKMHHANSGGAETNGATYDTAPHHMIPHDTSSHDMTPHDLTPRDMTSNNTPSHDAAPPPLADSRATQQPVFPGDIVHD